MHLSASNAPLVRAVTSGSSTTSRKPSDWPSYSYTKMAAIGRIKSDDVIDVAESDQSESRPSSMMTSSVMTSSVMTSSAVGGAAEPAGATVFNRNELKSLPIGQNRNRFVINTVTSPDCVNLSFSNDDESFEAYQNTGTRHRILVNSQFSSDDSRRRDSTALSTTGHRSESIGLSATDAGSLTALVNSRSPSSTTSNPIGCLPSCSGATTGATTSTTEGGAASGGDVHSPSETSLTKRQERPREGPSSRRTVLIIACCFVVGLMFVLSGIIVLVNEQHYAFRITASVFILTGAVSFVLGVFLQQKNVKKFMHDLQQDFYFLSFRENTKLLRSFFSFDSEKWNNSSTSTGNNQSRNA